MISLSQHVNIFMLTLLTAANCQHYIVENTEPTKGSKVMGIFANESDHPMDGARIMPDPSEGNDGFAALGKPVPANRKAAAYECLKDMGLDDAERRWSLIEAMSVHVERDNPHAAMERAAKDVDVTGCYRLLATLLAA